jgi:hypothetical protein
VERSSSAESKRVDAGAQGSVMGKDKDGAQGNNDDIVARLRPWRMWREGEVAPCG